ncbi:MAG TPA: helix-turn-helix transcriptional regulator [Sphingomonadaceae bacterium]|nr:helix-turn-helix transcriptional regulator [Sphingomonadaceae bacterium]
MKGSQAKGATAGRGELVDADEYEIDRYRSIVFPNMIRELRKHNGFPKLLSLSAMLPGIPYVRLSKIERGEVFAKAEELRRIATQLNVEPEQLLVDIDTPGFDIAAWAANLQDWTPADPKEDRFAVEFAAALRLRRESDAALSIAAIERDYGIAPVILSRLENAYKTFDRWNKQTVRALFRLFGVADLAALRAHVADARTSGMLAAHLELIANPAIRIAKTRARVAVLREELTKPRATATPRTKTPPPRRVPPVDLEAERAARTPSAVAAIQASDVAMVRLVPVFGSPLPDGLIERSATGETVEAPRRAGPNSYGLRACRQTLGPGLPASATVVVDPDRFPSSGGIAVVREAEGLRLLMVTFDRQGRMIGYSANPDREVALDTLDPADVATVISIILE